MTNHEIYILKSRLQNFTTGDSLSIHISWWALHAPEVLLAHLNQVVCRSLDGGGSRGTATSLSPRRVEEMFKRHEDHASFIQPQHGEAVCVCGGGVPYTVGAQSALESDGAWEERVWC